jgi:hypothetical protein
LDKGIYHRKTHLVSKEVEAALVPDQENRLMKGTYVRICPRNTAELSAFLEWAVNVQEAISAQYGEPTEVQEIKEASDPQAIVERIATDKERYMAVWKKEAEDAAIILSIGAMNERSVAFRLEYFSSALVKAFNDRLAAEKQRAAELDAGKPAAEAGSPKPESPDPKPENPVQ